MFVAGRIPEEPGCRVMGFESEDLGRGEDIDMAMGAFNARSQKVPSARVQARETKSIPLIWLENLSRN